MIRVQGKRQQYMYAQTLLKSQKDTYTTAFDKQLLVNLHLNTNKYYVCPQVAQFRQVLTFLGDTNKATSALNKCPDYTLPLRPSIGLQLRPFFVLAILFCVGGGQTKSFLKTVPFITQIIQFCHFSLILISLSNMQNKALFIINSLHRFYIQKQRLGHEQNAVAFQKR